MKYIRTSEKIFEITSEAKVKSLNSDEFYYLVSINGFEKAGQFPKKEWENTPRAYTIEELCDEFVDTSELKTTNTGGWLYDEFDSKNKSLVYYVEDERRTIPLNEFDDLSKIYGAIWTKWGLRYVAKMNNKGELELL